VNRRGQPRRRYRFAEQIQKPDEPEEYDWDPKHYKEKEPSLLRDLWCYANVYERTGLILAVVGAIVIVWLIVRRVP